MVPAADAGGRVRARVLIVEDNAASAESMTRLLELFVREVAGARDGPKAQEAAPASRPEFVAPDLGMPAM
jgi:CheY-like chemotaxis protein